MFRINSVTYHFIYGSAYAFGESMVVQRCRSSTMFYRVVMDKGVELLCCNSLHCHGDNEVKYLFGELAAFFYALYLVAVFYYNTPWRDHFIC